MDDSEPKYGHMYRDEALVLAVPIMSNSFYFSEGSTHVQDKLFRGLSFHPQFKILVDRGLPETPPQKVLDIKTHPSHIPMDIILDDYDDTMRSEWNALLEIVKQGEKQGNIPDDILDQLIFEMCKKEENMLRDGRPGLKIDNPEIPDADQDLYASWLRRFVINYNPDDFKGRVKEMFSWVFAQAHQYFDANWKKFLQPELDIALLNGADLQKYQNLINVRDMWEAHHLGKKFID